MALKFYSDIEVPNIQATRIQTDNIQATNEYTNNAHIEVLEGLTHKEVTTAHIYDDHIINAYINNLYKYPDKEYIDIYDSVLPQGKINLGVLEKPFETIYGDMFYGRAMKIESLMCIKNTGYNNKPIYTLFGDNGILADIDTRLTNLGFKKGSISITGDCITSTTSSLYQLGDIYYGWWGPIKVSYGSNPLTTITITCRDNNNNPILMKWMCHSQPPMLTYTNQEDGTGALDGGFMPTSKDDYIKLEQFLNESSSFCTIDMKGVYQNVASSGYTIGWLAPGFIIASTNDYNNRVT